MVIFHILLTVVGPQGYTYYPFRGCNGRDEIFDGLVNSLDKCKYKCDDDDNCMSFEYWGPDNPHWNYGIGYCHVSSTCTYELSVEEKKGYKGEPGSHLYIKTGN